MRITPEITALIKQGRDYAEACSDAFIRVSGIDDEMSKLKFRIYLSTQAMFPQLNEDEWAIIAELMTCADLNALHVIDGEPSPLRRVFESERLNLWDAARGKFISQNILMKLDETQKAFAELFLLRTHSN